MQEYLQEFSVLYGVHRRGERYPEHKFDDAIRIESHNDVLCTSNAQIRDYIDKCYQQNPETSEVMYLYVSIP